MESFRSVPPLLDILHRQLRREWNYLEDGRVDLAIFYFKTIHRTLRRLESLPPPPESSRELLHACQELHDRIHLRLEEESRGISRTLFETGVERQIRTFLRRKES